MAAPRAVSGAHVAPAGLGLLGAILLAGCGGGPPPPGGDPPPPPRGVVLISVDTLRADHLGAYGYERPTSPFFDSLAARGVLFERVAVQYPSTLTSHMSIFTGLYPLEHRVLPPDTVLAAEIETLPERFRAHGFRTAGHTEGGFVAGGYGFARGFEEFTDHPYRADTDVERTFNLGTRFLARLGPEERFFLFLHTYTVHDPYEPPPAYRSLFAGPPPPGAFSSEGEHLRQVNLGQRPVTVGTARHFEALYDGSIRYFDDVLARFFASLERLGLDRDTLVVVTSDHGEEFLEHGKLAHVQVYPECLFVPLLIVHPGLEKPVRVRRLVQSIDLAPTLYELAGLPPAAGLSGRSLAPWLAPGAGAATGRAEAHAEVFEREAVRTLLVAERRTSLQLLRFEPKPDPEGSWIQREVTFDSERPVLELEAQSFHRPRWVAVTVDGEPFGRLELETSWRPYRLELPTGRPIYRVGLEADGCDSPRQLGVGDDARCLSFQLRGAALSRLELYDLARDPLAQDDLSLERPELKRRLAHRLAEYDFETRAEPEVRELTPEAKAALRALGYLD